MTVHSYGLVFSDPQTEAINACIEPGFADGWQAKLGEALDGRLGGDLLEHHNMVLPSLLRRDYSSSEEYQAKYHTSLQQKDNDIDCPVTAVIEAFKPTSPLRSHIFAKHPLLQGQVDFGFCLLQQREI